MSRPALIGIAALGLTARSVPAQGKSDCGAAYKGFLEEFHKEKAASLPADRVANAHRIALRAFDACNAGDELNAKSLFDALDRESY
jgi:hypothetical protein